MEHGEAEIRVVMVLLTDIRFLREIKIKYHGIIKLLERMLHGSLRLIRRVV